MDRVRRKFTGRLLVGPDALPHFVPDPGHEEAWRRHTSNMLHRTERVDIVCEPHEPWRRRSTQMNRYYWKVVVGILMGEFGYQKDEMHTELKLLHLSHEEEITVNGVPHTKVITPSISILGDDEFWDYIQRIRRWAREKYAIEIPDPKRMDF